MSWKGNINTYILPYITEVHNFQALFFFFFFMKLTCRVLSEIDSVLGTKTFVNAEDLQKLEYTEQVSTV